MNPLTEIALVVARELRKNVRSAKGLSILALSLLGGTGATLLLLKLEELKRTNLHDVPPDALLAMREKTLSGMYGDEAMGKLLAAAPDVLLAVLNLSIWLAPLVIALIGFDAISGEVQHRSVRYWTVRTRRWSFVVGKFVGLWAVVSMITLVMNAFIWVVCIARGESLATTLGWGVRFWLVTLPISAAWCGIATLVGSLFRTPMLSLLLTLGTFFALWLLDVIGTVSSSHALVFAYPNSYDQWLLSPRPDRAFGGLAICLGMAAATMAGASALFARRDV